MDELGRVVIPVELRRTLGIVEGTALNFHVDGENIVLRKYEKSCFVTGEVSETKYRVARVLNVLSKEGAIELLDLIQKSGMAHA